MNTKASPLHVKKELNSDDIKDFAESAMNELLGWYGYDKINQNEMGIKNSKGSLSSGAKSNEKLLSRENLDRESLNQNEIKLTNSKKGNAEYQDKNESSNSAAGICDDSEYESLCDSSKSHFVLKSLRTETNCSWCRRIVALNSSEILRSPDGPIFCSESCFSQSRRANFKKAKVCDWCKHVRHSVNYVDFQENASQLQFCSDKCLNQYKMQIFCNETQAHLDMNPHLKEKIDSSNNLITPDLWLKNCRSRSQSPTSDPSRTPSPHNIPSEHPNLNTSISASQTSESLKKKPIITVAPVSKLFNKNLATKQTIRTVKRRRRSLRTDTFHGVHISPETGNHQSRLTVPPTNVQQPNFRPFQSLLKPVPPVTVLVPYPIILPIVIPIPIPLPILKPLNIKNDEKVTITEDPSFAQKGSNKTPEKYLPNDIDVLEIDNEQRTSEKGEVKKDENAEHKLPKFKITRLASKRIFAKECEKEKNRPLRKRKFDQHQIIELDTDK